MGILALSGPRSQASQTGKGAVLPTLPPLTHPTYAPHTPLTAKQADAHRVKIQAVKQSRPDAFPPTPERMAPKAEREQHDLADRQRGLDFDRIWRGNPTRREIALTFDDGPHPLYTPRLLDLLRQWKVPATFFLVGKKVDEAPYLVQDIVRDGHEVGNHTYHHVNLTKIPADIVEDEIRLDNDAIVRACGIVPRWFRPPGGQYNDATVRAADKLNMTSVFWTDDPADYVSPGDAVIEARLLPHIRNGAVILLHDGIEQTLEVLPDLITRLRREGYTFVTISEIARHLEATRVVHK